MRSELSWQTMTQLQHNESPFAPLGPKSVKVPKTVQEGDMVSPSTNERIAHAMEYIAAHIGRIDRKLEKIIERLDGLKVLGRDQK
jgi:hypothetical protein